MSVHSTIIDQIQYLILKWFNFEKVKSKFLSAAKMATLKDGSRCQRQELQCCHDWKLTTQFVIQRINMSFEFICLFKIHSLIIGCLCEGEKILSNLELVFSLQFDLWRWDLKEREMLSYQELVHSWQFSILIVIPLKRESWWCYILLSGTWLLTAILLKRESPPMLLRCLFPERELPMLHHMFLHCNSLLFISIGSKCNTEPGGDK